MSLFLNLNSNIVFIILFTPPIISNLPLTLFISGNTDWSFFSVIFSKSMFRYIEVPLAVLEYVTFISFKDEQPVRGTTTHSNPILSVDVTNYQDELMDITFRTNTSGSWQDITSYHCINNGIYTANWEV